MLKNSSIQNELLQPEGNGDYRIHKNGSGVYLAQYKNINGDWTTFTEEKKVPNQDYTHEQPIGGFSPIGAFNHIFHWMLLDII